MNIYVASSVSRALNETRQLYEKTKDLNNIDIFFPEHLGVFSSSIEDMKYIDVICCNKIRESDVMIAVVPFGYSVSVEIGRFLECNRNTKKFLILLDVSAKKSAEFRKLTTEAMLMPHIDFITHSIDELLNILEELNQKYLLL